MTGETAKDKGTALVRRLFDIDPTTTGLPEPFLSMTVDHVFGEVWQQPGLGVEERSLITCALLAALGREHELKVHMGGAKRLGHSRQRMEALMTHVAHYAGWPAGVGGMRAVAEAWGKDG